MEDTFLEFLSGLADGRCTPEAWRRYAVEHYQEPRLEEARVQLVRVSIAGGEMCWPSVPDAVKAVAAELRDALSR